MAAMRRRFAPMFGYEKIPLMDEMGCLYYRKEGEDDVLEIKRVGGGFMQGKTSPPLISPKSARSQHREGNRSNSS